MTDPIQIDLNRPQRYWYVDGLAEMAGGAVIFLIGLVYTVSGWLPQGLARGLLVGPGQIIVILGAGWLARWAVPRLKERLTYPRTGYVEYQRPVRSRRLARVFMVGLMGFAVSVLTAFLGRGLPERLWSFFIGLTLALAFAYLGARIGLRRFYALAGFSLLLGAAGSWLNLIDPWSAAFIFGLEGLAWLVCGALVLRHYLRSTRPLAGEGLDE